MSAFPPRDHISQWRRINGAAYIKTFNEVLRQEIEALNTPDDIVSPPQHQVSGLNEAEVPPTEQYEHDGDKDQAAATPTHSPKPLAPRKRRRSVRFNEGPHVYKRNLQPSLDQAQDDDDVVYLETVPRQDHADPVWEAAVAEIERNGREAANEAANQAESQAVTVTPSPPEASSVNYHLFTDTYKHGFGGVHDPYYEDYKKGGNPIWPRDMNTCLLFSNSAQAHVGGFHCIDVERQVDGLTFKAARDRCGDFDKVREDDFHRRREWMKYTALANKQFAAQIKELVYAGCAKPDWKPLPMHYIVWAEYCEFLIDEVMNEKQFPTDWTYTGHFKFGPVLPPTPGGVLIDTASTFKYETQWRQTRVACAAYEYNRTNLPSVVLFDTPPPAYPNVTKTHLLKRCNITASEL